METEKALEDRVVERLKRNHWKITTAESCSGGLLAGTLVNVPGVSDAFEEGYITYSNEAKHRLLGVDTQVLNTYGAVSAQVAAQMAEGACRAASAEVSIAVTGIAGPDGGTEEKPVGLVYIGCHVPGKTKVSECCFHGSRREIREQTVKTAFALLLELL